MSKSKPESLLQAFCLYKTHLAMLFALCLVFLVLSTGSLLVISPQTPGYFVAAINVATLTVFLIPLGSLLWYCRGVE